MKIRKRYILLGIILCLTIGPAGVAAILALLKHFEHTQKD